MSKNSITDSNIKTTSPGDIVDLILKDHLPLKDLIPGLKSAEVKREAKEVPLEQFVTLLTSHAKAEEKTLYVEMKNYKPLRRQSFEGDTGHELADTLVQEINAAADDDEWNAKVKLLAELVENHMKEEEGEILPAVVEVMDFQVRMKTGTEYTEYKQKFDTLAAASPDRRKQKIIEDRAH